jgi:hypothetical protein
MEHLNLAEAKHWTTLKNLLVTNTLAYFTKVGNTDKKLFNINTTSQSQIFFGVNALPLLEKLDLFRELREKCLLVVK